MALANSDGVGGEVDVGVGGVPPIILYNSKAKAPITMPPRPTKAIGNQ